MPPSNLPEPVTPKLASPSAHRWRTRLFQLYLLLAALGFGALLALATTLPYLPLDVGITLAVQRLDLPVFRALMRWVSWPGFGPQAALIVVAAGLALWAARLRWEAVCALLAGFGPAVISTAIKFLIQRPRPASALVQVAEVLHSFSFPSGHVLFYTVFFGFLFYLAYSLFRRSVWRLLALLSLGLLVALVGLSRIDLGQHWFSDVLAAYLLGSVGLAGMVRVYRWGKGRWLKA